MSDVESLFGIRVRHAPDGWYEIVHDQEGAVIRIRDRPGAVNACLAFAIAQSLSDEHPWLLHRLITRLTDEQHQRDPSYTAK